jgi:hypothetical protein
MRERTPIRLVPEVAQHARYAYGRQLGCQRADCCFRVSGEVNALPEPIGLPVLEFETCALVRHIANAIEGQAHFVLMRHTQPAPPAVEREIHRTAANRTRTVQGARLRLRTACSQPSTPFGAVKRPPADG